MAKGFAQTRDVDFSGIYNLVVKLCTVILVMSLAVFKGWDVKRLDVNNAFLNEVITGDVCMAQPDGFRDETKPHHVCKLHKALYLKTCTDGMVLASSSSLASLGFCRISSRHFVVHFYQ